jgi:hypothetical protein
MLNSKLFFLTSWLISFSFLTTFLITISSIIDEKTTKTKVKNTHRLQIIEKILKYDSKLSTFKEYLKLIGVKQSVIWLSWIIRSFSIYLILSIVICIGSTIRIKYPGGEKALFLHTDPFIIFLTCIVYSVQVTSLTLLIGQIFSKGKKSKPLNNDSIA